MGAGIGNKDSENQGGNGRDIKSRRLSAAIHPMYRHLNRIRKEGYGFDGGERDRSSSDSTMSAKGVGGSRRLVLSDGVGSVSGGYSW